MRTHGRIDIQFIRRRLLAAACILMAVVLFGFPEFLNLVSFPFSVQTATFVQFYRRLRDVGQMMLTDR
jgi:hypothetical protein